MFATPEEFVRTPMTRLPQTWTRVAVLDVDSARIGINWAAHDRTADVAYVYDCVVTPRSDLSLLAATLRDRGSWFRCSWKQRPASAPRPSACASRNASTGLGWTCTAHVRTSAPAVEETANRLSTGRLRVHDHLAEWFAGYRRY